MRFLFWLGVVLAADALIGLCGLNFWRRIVPPRFDIGRIAAVEGVVAIVLLAAYFILLRL